MDLKAGDLIAISGKCAVSRMIQLGTWSLPNVWPLEKYSGVSHVGIVCPVWDEMLIYESTSLGRGPCARTGRQNPKGVQAHYVSEFLSSGDTVWHYPLSRELYDHEVFRLSQYLESCLGRGYDFAGAGRTAGGPLSYALTTLFGGDKQEYLFCSELVAAAWKEVGVFQTKNPGAWNPNRLVRVGLRSGLLKPGNQI